jgi:hypothetical protein
MTDAAAKSKKCPFVDIVMFDRCLVAIRGLLSHFVHDVVLARVLNRL